MDLSKVKSDSFDLILLPATWLVTHKTETFQLQNVG